MERVLLLERIQRYVRRNVALRRTVIAFPPFTLFLHPTDTTPEANFATLDQTTHLDELPRKLAAVLREFDAHHRSGAFQFVGEIPDPLDPALRAAGFAEHRHEPIMICTPDLFRPIPPASGIRMATLDSSSALDLVRVSLETNEWGFDPSFQGHLTDAETETYRARLVEARAFLAYLAEEPVGAGMFDPPVDGVTELVGITTVMPFRRRGVATALTARALSEAFSRGIELVFLTTANEDARRVYQRLGFHHVGARILYVLGDPAPSAQSKLC
jgi:ribosomal protein S18 acetylase RimI-like enzyme